MTDRAFDAIKVPEHYNTHPSGVEPITITSHMGFLLGNVIKYVMRCDYKGKRLEDLEKAYEYLGREIEMERERERTITADRITSGSFTPGQFIYSAKYEYGADQTNR